jgi:hypothetical protein
MGKCIWYLDLGSHSREHWNHGVDRVDGVMKVMIRMETTMLQVSLLSVVAV